MCQRAAPPAPAPSNPSYPALPPAAAATMPQCAVYVDRSQPQLLGALHRWTMAITPALSAYLRQKQHASAAYCPCSSRRAKSFQNLT